MKILYHNPNIKSENGLQLGILPLILFILAEIAVFFFEINIPPFRINSQIPGLLIFMIFIAYTALSQERVEAIAVDEESHYLVLRSLIGSPFRHSVKTEHLDIHQIKYLSSAGTGISINMGGMSLFRNRNLPFLKAELVPPIMEEIQKIQAQPIPTERLKRPLDEIPASS